MLAGREDSLQQSTKAIQSKSMKVIATVHELATAMIQLCEGVGVFADETWISEVNQT